MSINLKKEFMQTLCHDLSERDIEKLVETIQLKIQKGFGVEEIAAQLITAIGQTILITAPHLTDSEVLDIAEDIGDALIDRVMEHYGLPIDMREHDEEEEGVPPREQLN